MEFLTIFDMNPMSNRLSKSVFHAFVVAASIAIFCTAVVGNAAAQNAEISGFVLVNAVASSDPIMASYDGKSVLAPPGLRQASATSGLGVGVGSGVISVSHPTLGSAEAAMEIKVGTTPIVVAFTENTVAKPGQPAKQKIALQVLPAKSSKQPLFRVFYAAGKSDSAVNLKLNNKAATLLPWRSQMIQDSNLSVVVGETSIGNFSLEGSEPNAVFIARDGKNGFFAVSVPEIIYNW